jgi:hypothetical protein
VPQAILDAVLDEGKWLFGAMLFAGLAVLVTHSRVLRMSGRREVMRALNVFYGCMIGTMGLGHLAAVTVRMAQGTLQGSPVMLYPLGLALALPAWWLAIRAKRYVLVEERYGKRLVVLNAWLALFLVGLGLHNFPLAAPAMLNVAYQFHTRRVLGWTIVTVAVAANIALFAGSLVFMATGLSFEQFQGMD